MKWTDGSVYEGEWLKGIQHGYGKTSIKCQMKMKLLNQNFRW